MKKGILIGLALILLLGVLGLAPGTVVAVPAGALTGQPVVPMTSKDSSGNLTAMIVFYIIADEMYLFWCDMDATIKDKGDKWDVHSNQGNWNGVSKDAVTYGYYKWKEIIQPTDDDGVPIPIYMADLDLEPMTAEGLPKSQHIAVLKAVNPALAKPATVTRTYYGVDYDFQCFVSQSVVDMWQSNDLEVGDYVVVSFITEAPGTTEVNIAIVVDKVYPSW